jgi:hypothetical protein
VPPTEVHCPDRGIRSRRESGCPALSAAREPHRWEEVRAAMASRHDHRNRDRDRPRSGEEAGRPDLEHRRTILA